MTKFADAADRTAAGLGLVARGMAWLLLLPLCAVAYGLATAFGSRSGDAVRTPS